MTKSVTTLTGNPSMPPDHDPGYENRKKERLKRKRTILKFWWDYDYRLSKQNLIVESNDPKYPIIAIYPIVGEFADDEIEMAETLIEELTAGRKNYRELAKLIK